MQLNSNVERNTLQIIAECTKPDKDNELSDKTIVLKLISLFKVIGTVGMQPRFLGHKGRKDILAFLTKFHKQIGNLDIKLFKPFFRLLTLVDNFFKTESNFANLKISFFNRINDHWNIIRFFKQSHSHLYELLNIYLGVLNVSKSYLKNR